MKAATIEIRQTRGHIAVVATGRTPSGQRYIKDTITLDVQVISDPKFKAQMADAVLELLESEA